MFEVFELQIVNFYKGDKFEFIIFFVEVYGEYDEEYVIDFFKNIFEIDGKFDNEYIYLGNIIFLMNLEGQCLNGSVVEVKVDMVVMDMNYLLVGEDLIFVGEVIESCLVINEEIQEMIKMMIGEGGCSCGSCGDGCGDDCGDSCGDSCGCGYCY